LEFDSAGFEDLAWWVQHDRKKALRLIRLIQETHKDPFSGTGKPEPLRHQLAGCWSRRIDEEHRLVYQVLKDKIRILACRYHSNCPMPFAWLPSSAIESALSLFLTQVVRLSLEKSAAFPRRLPS
jgi:toxin YoeB